MVSQRLFVTTAIAATLLAMMVVVLGAYVRLSNAGLSCPDWPGCYGQLTVPRTDADVERANLSFPERPVEIAKAWKEMAHRYLAGILGLLVLALAIMAWRRRGMPGQARLLPAALLALVVFQAALGMLTVTRLLAPVVVTAHLLAGVTTLALLWWLSLRQGRLFVRFGGVTIPGPAPHLRIWVLIGIAVLYVQLALGGWTSTNYAALACPDFPMCQGRWWPQADFDEAFRLWTSSQRGYEGGVLSAEARTAIQLAHRLGALVTFLYIVLLCVGTLRVVNYRPTSAACLAVLAMLLVQVGLGISNIIYVLPMTLAVAHNAVAALLLLALVTFCHTLYPTRVAI